MRGSVEAWKRGSVEAWSVEASKRGRFCSRGETPSSQPGREPRAGHPRHGAHGTAPPTGPHRHETPRLRRTSCNTWMATYYPCPRRTCPPIVESPKRRQDLAEHGALEYRECAADDLDVKWVSVPATVEPQADKTVVFAVDRVQVTCASRSHQRQGHEGTRGWRTSCTRSTRSSSTHTTGYGPYATTSKPSFDMTVQGAHRLDEPARRAWPAPDLPRMGSGDAYGADARSRSAGPRGGTRRASAAHRRLALRAQLFLAAPTLQAFLATRYPRYSGQQSRTAARNPLWNTYRRRTSGSCSASRTATTPSGRSAQLDDAPSPATPLRDAGAPPRARPRAGGAARCRARPPDGRRMDGALDTGRIAASPVATSPTSPPNPQRWQND